MSNDKSKDTFNWSYDAYAIWYEHRIIANLDRANAEAKLGFFERTQLINFLINCAIALAFILGFIGFIVFPHVMVPGSLLLTGCLITSQALSGFGILATLIRAVHAIYDMGWKETLRMLFWSPRYHFTQTPVQTILLLLGILAIALIIILSVTGTIYIPFLNVFAAHALSLEVLEILWGLVSDIAAIMVGLMAFYLFSHLGKKLDERQREQVDFSQIEESQELNEEPPKYSNCNHQLSHNLDHKSDGEEEESSEDETVVNLILDEQPNTFYFSCNLL